MKEFLFNSGIYTISNGVSKLFNFLLFAYIARTITIAQMGQYSLINIFLLIISLIITFEIQSGFTRYYFEWSEQDRQKFEYSTINLIAIMSFLWGIILFLSRKNLYQLLLPISDMLFIVVLVIPFTTTLSNLFLSKLRLESKAKEFSVVIICQSLIYISVTFALLNIIPNKLLAIFSGLLAQQLFICGLYIIKYGNNWRPYLHFGYIKRSLNFSIALVPAVFGAQLSSLSGKYILNMFWGNEPTGIYEAQVKVVSMVNLIVEPLYLATVPITFRDYKKTDFRKTYLLLLSINIVLLMLLVAFLSIFLKEIMLLVVGSKYSSYLNLAIILVIVYFSIGAARLLIVNIHLSQKSQYVTICELFSGLLNVILTIILVRQYNLIGAGWAALISYCIRLVIYFIMANKLFPRFKINIGIGFLIFITMILMVICNYYLEGIPILARLLIYFVEAIALILMFTHINHISIRQLKELLVNSIKPVKNKV